MTKSVPHLVLERPTLLNFMKFGAALTSPSLVGQINVPPNLDERFGQNPYSMESVTQTKLLLRLKVSVLQLMQDSALRKKCLLIAQWTLVVYSIKTTFGQALFGIHHPSYR